MLDFKFETHVNLGKDEAEEKESAIEDAQAVIYKNLQEMAESLSLSYLQEKISTGFDSDLMKEIADATNYIYKREQQILILGDMAHNIMQKAKDGSKEGNEENDMLENQLEQLKNEKSIAAEKNRELEEIVHQLEKEKSNLEGYLTDLENEYGKEDSLHSKGELIRIYKSENDELSKDIKKLKWELKYSITEIEGVKEKFADIYEKFEEVSEEQVFMMKSYNTITYQSNKIKEKIAHTEKLNQKLLDQYETLQKTVDEKENNLKSLLSPRWARSHTTALYTKYESGFTRKFKRDEEFHLGARRVSTTPCNNDTSNDEIHQERLSREGSIEPEEYSAKVKPFNNGEDLKSSTPQNYWTTSNQYERGVLRNRLEMQESQPEEAKKPGNKQSPVPALNLQSLEKREKGEKMIANKNKIITRSPNSFRTSSGKVDKKEKTPESVEGKGIWRNPRGYHMRNILIGGGIGLALCSFPFFMYRRTAARDEKLA